MLRADAVTLGAWLHDAARRLALSGVASPRADAERLAAHGLGVGWSDLWTRLRDDVDVGPLDALVGRRCDGEPLAYITGSVVFRGIELACGPGVLVPRPETETLVDVALELIAGLDAPVVVDVGTGSGAIAIAIARTRLDSTVVATDVSAEAIGYARRNIAAVAADVRLERGHLFDAVPSELHGRIDLVVSNPPYVPDREALPPDVRAEPREALRAGPRGDEVLVEIADQVGEWLSVRGALALEVGTLEQAVELRGRLVAWTITGVRDDDTGRPRVVWAKR